ncbi:phage tail tube protein [Pseudomonas abietaniphila]|uniref:phage tail tube protein n=1 Tax=Pseudomonas abietaniphila TaxID=89065 RepID=UPI0007844B2F|nr:phage tail tube protein [Pseudomonas abietaniphila]
MTKRVPLPNGTTVWVSAQIDPSTQAPPDPSSASWVELKKITSLTQSGGDERFASFTPLGEYEDIRKPSGRNPIDVQLTLEDDPGSAHLTAIATGRDAQQALGWKYKLPNGANITYAGYASGGLLPVMDRNQLMVLNFTIAVQGTPKRFTA